MSTEPIHVRQRADAQHLARLFLAFVVAGCGIVIAAPPASGASASSRAALTAKVTIVHGLRGKLVDIYVDGSLFLPAFQPDRITDPTTVPSGAHKIELREAGSPATSTPNATAEATLAAGSATTIVAYFTADSKWTVATYPGTEPAPSTSGDGRVVFRNNSSVGPVDVSVDGSKMVSQLAAPSEVAKELAARPSYKVEATAAGGVVVPAQDVAVTAGRTRVLYLVGNSSDLTWLTQDAATNATRPGSVGTGNSGLAAGSFVDSASHSGARAPWTAALLIVAVVLGVGSLRRRDRSTS